MNGYYQKDKGVFNVWLIRESDNVAIAYTDSDEVILTSAYADSDLDAVNEFSNEYDLEIAY